MNPFATTVRLAPNSRSVELVSLVYVFYSLFFTCQYVYDRVSLNILPIPPSANVGAKLRTTFHSYKTNSKNILPEFINPTEYSQDTSDIKH